jgi:hypothetical protein
LARRRKLLRRKAPGFGNFHETETQLQNSRFRGGYGDGRRLKSSKKQARGIAKISEY